jgi:uncharacterized protein YodC (DUF2158 family)
MQFEEGQKVRSVEGGPVMVVDGAYARLVTCLVMTEAGLERKVFPAAALKKAVEEWVPPISEPGAADRA